MLRTTAKFLILFLGLWGFTVVILELMGITIYFPFHISPNREIPYHHWQTVRLSVFLTFAFFSIRYFIWESVKLYPVQFLDYYIKILTFTGIILFLKLDIIKDEYILVLFFILASIFTHIAATPKYRNYFIK